MNKSLHLGRYFFAAAMIALGVTGFVNGDFALGWQNVPHSLPGYEVIAYACAAIELVIGLGLLLNRTVTLASRVLFPYMLLWLVLLKIPVIVHASLNASSWGGFGEIGVMAAGAWCLFAACAGSWETKPLKFAVGPAGIRAARWLFIATLPMLAAEVIVAAVAAGDHVMQPWLQHLPYPEGWAILSGVGHIAVFLALLFGVVPRLAARLEAAMVSAIALIYWAPVLYTGRTATTVFIITLLVSAGALIVADTYRKRKDEVMSQWEPQ